MNARLVLAVAMLSVGPGCSSPLLKDGDCFIGEAGCSCTSRGGCDPGLECNADDKCGAPVADGDAQWNALDDTGLGGDTLSTNEAPRDFYDLLVVDRQIFLTYFDERMIRVLDLGDGSVTDIPVDWPAVELAFDATTGVVIVTLPRGYDEPDEQDAHVALIDVASLDVRIIGIPTPPGAVVAAGGTGFVALGWNARPPWSALEIDLREGSVVQHVGDDYPESWNVGLHPAADRIYADESNSYPGHLFRWNLVGGHLTDTVRTEATFDNLGLRVDPVGARGYLADGTVIRFDDDPALDMVSVGSLGPDGRWVDLVFNPTATRAYAIPVQGRGIWIFDTESRKQVGSFRPKADGLVRIAAGPDSLFVVEGSILAPSTMVQIDEVSFP